MSQDNNCEDVKVDEAEEKMLKKFQKDLEKAENDKTGFVLLDLVCEYLGLETEPQEETKENNENENTNIWSSLKESALKIGECTKEFVKNLKNARLSKELRDEVADVCKDFKKLLQVTVMDLQKYRHDIEGIENTISSIIKALLPPRRMFRKLKKLDEDDCWEMIEDFAEENKEKLKSRLEILSSKMKKNSNSQKLLDDGNEWLALGKKIKEVLNKISDRQKKFKRFMMILGGIAGAAVCAVIIAASCGAAAPLGVALGISTKLVIGLVAGGAALVCGGALAGFVFAGVPKLCDVLSGRMKALNAISAGLKRISEQSDVMDTILKKVHKQWIETINNDPKKSYQEFSIDVIEEGVLQQLYRTKTKLLELKTSIKETEDVCENELDGYTKNIYRPLLDLY